MVGNGYIVDRKPKGEKVDLMARVGGLKENAQGICYRDL
jgi:hypothetical protein